MIDWTHWHNEPHLVGGLVILGWLYAVLTGPMRGRIAPTAPYPRGHAIQFYLALVIFYLAVGSPLDQIGERYLLTAHMIQHQLLIYPAAILFLRGLPPWLVSVVFSRNSMKAVGRFVTRPIACCLIYTLVLSVWHVPALYDWALQNRWVHIAEHVTFFGAALFYWWPLLSPSTDVPRLEPGAQMLYLVAVTITMTPVFAFLAFSSDVLYPTYEYAPRVLAGLSPLEDQKLGSAVMKAGGLLTTFIGLSAAFYRLSRKDRIGSV